MLNYSLSVVKLLSNADVALLVTIDSLESFTERFVNLELFMGMSEFPWKWGSFLFPPTGVSIHKTSLFSSHSRGILTGFPF